MLQPSDAIQEATVSQSLEINGTTIQILEDGKGSGLRFLKDEKEVHFIAKKQFGVMAGNSTTYIARIKASPNSKYLEVLLIPPGAITFYEYRLIDLTNFKIQVSLSRLQSYPYWSEDNESFGYRQWSGPDVLNKQHVLNQDPKTDIIVSRDEITFEVFSFAYDRLILTKIIPETAIEDILAHFDSKENGEVIQRVTPTGSLDGIIKTTLVPENPRGVIRSVTPLDSDAENSFFAVHYSWGAKNWVSVFDLTGKNIKTIDLPVGVTVDSLTVDSTRVLVMTCRSITGIRLNMGYDPMSDTYFDENNLPTDLKVHTDRFSNIYVNDEWMPVTIKALNSKTHDQETAETIPSVMVWKRDAEQTDDRPTLIEVYGGFGVDQLRRHWIGAEAAQFINDGGMIVVSGLRGGSEKGNQWHRDATHSKKINSAKDLISVAQDLVAKSYTKPERIAITGGSNGGLVTATALVLSPESFGLAIPENGVLNPLSSQWLDAPFFGWSLEYGSSITGTTYQYMKDYDPYAQITDKKYPAVLVIVGLEDDRVNPAHSFKFVNKLQRHQKGKAPILLAAIKNTGHGPQGSVRPEIRNAYQARFWTMIYDTIVHPKD